MASNTSIQTTHHSMTQIMQPLIHRVHLFEITAMMNLNHLGIT